MAIYHLSVKAIQRSKGRSATASAAYRSRAKITDERTGKVYDYSRRKGVEDTQIFTPDGSKIFREELWNLAEAAERRKDGITAREYELALPSELDAEARKNLTKNFCSYLMNKYGVAVDSAIHAPTQEGDQRNHHAHVMVTTRKFTAGKLGEKSEFDLSGRDLQKKGLKSQKEQLEEIRAEWEKLANKELEISGSQERISHKSHEARGIKAIPTVHLGVAATAMERKGIPTDRGNLNRHPILRKMYEELREMKKNLRVLEEDLARIRQEKGERENAPTQKSHDTRGNQGAYEPAQGSRPAQATNAGSKKPVQPNQVATGRSEKFKKNAGGTGKNTGNPPERPESPHRSLKRNSQGTGRIFTERPSRGVRGGENSGTESAGYRGSERTDLGGTGKARETSWLEQIERIKNFFLERIIEYRTIGDILAMRDGIEARPEEEKKLSEEPEGPK